MGHPGGVALLTALSQQRFDRFFNEAHPALESIARANNGLDECHLRASNQGGRGVRNPADFDVFSSE